MLISHMWQVAAVLDCTVRGLEKCSEHMAPCLKGLCIYTLSMVHRLHCDLKMICRDPDRSGGSAFRLSSGM